MSPTATTRAPDAPLTVILHALPGGEVDYVNDAWCAYTGLSLARSRGDGWQRALHPDDVAHWQAAWARGASAGLTVELSCRLSRADGVYCWFLSRVEAIRGVTDEIAGWLGAATAADDGPSPARVRATGLLPEPAAPDTLRETNTYVAAAAHDLKNELAVIRGTAQLLERQVRRASPMGPEQLLPGLGLIQRATTKMRLLVEEFLDLSHLQSGQPVEFYQQPTDLVALARDCVAAHAQSTDHILTLSTTVEALIGEWDAARLERVLANLLSNAIKYSAPGSAIGISIQCDRRDQHDRREGRDEYDGAGGRDVAVLIVQDHGLGIPAQDLPHIFAPYYRGRNVVHRTAGSGIGLFGARAIVEHQGGTIDVQSTEKLGTTITVRLPLTALADPPWPARAPNPRDA